MGRQRESGGHRLSSGLRNIPGAPTIFIDVGNQLSCALVLADGQVYYVTVRAYDASGVLSAPSNEIVVSTLVAPPPSGDPGTGRVNVALAGNGGAATASSIYGPAYPESATINGDRKGVNWGADGVWMDETANAFPDWVEIAFTGTRTIDEVDVIGLEDAWANPVEPTATQTFSAYGLVDFTVQYWTGTAWQAVPGGVVRGNTLVWRRLTFAPVTTARIRLLVEQAPASFSRVVEIEAWTSSSGGGGTANVAPVVALTSPAIGAFYTAPATVALSATASDADGSIRDVTFYANGSPIGTDTTSPYAGTWSGMAAGTYSIIAVATDNTGAATTSTAAAITVSATTSPPPSTRMNVALAANGAHATASSTYDPGYPANATINGDRRGAGWSAGGVWMDGTANVFPDWLEIAFTGTRTIDEVDVIGLQDAWANPLEPTPTQTFSAYGLVDFTVQYWTGTAWQAVPGGVVRGNTLVWRRLTFAPVTTARIRLLVEQAPASFSRVVEIEAWTSSSGGGGTANVAPVVALTSPAIGAFYTAPATVALSATASDLDGSIRDVTFYANGSPIGTDTTSPYAGTWSSVAAGTYSISAVATDNAGAATTSTPASITVSATTSPPPSTRMNVALAANGGLATASSTYEAAYPVSAIINGDRRGSGWSAGGVWMDGTANVFPDWVEVAFNGTQTIDEVAVIGLQDAWANPLEPTATQTFSAYGLVDFTVQYWTGTAWQAVPGGVVRGNTLVWRRLTFAPVTTARIRLLVEQAPASFSRVVEIEAYSAANAPPIVALTSPATGAVYSAPATVALSATASDADGSIRDVTFYANGVAIGTDTTSPYAGTWSGIAAGSHTVTALATDNTGATTTSAPATILVSGTTSRVNVAAAANGGVATASSTYGPAYPASATINGDRLGAGWGAGGAWMDGTANAFPDWVEVAFNGTQTIDEVDVIGLQDAWAIPVEPTATLTAAAYGLVDFTVQYWTGTAWQAVPGGVIRGNTLVWRRLTFAPVTTSRIRVLVEQAPVSFSRVVEIEAWR